MNPLDTWYPTPPELIARLLAGLKFERTSRVLDPSAGRGDILDAVKEQCVGTSWRNYYSFTPKLLACEINPDMRAVLRSKGYTLLADDFLRYHPQQGLTHIIMNPPFNAGVHHLLHAWEILRTGEIRCFLNAVNLIDPDSQYDRRVLQLIEEHGSWEHLGQAFARAERPTDVEVALVRLSKPDTDDPFAWRIRNNGRPDLEFKPVELVRHGNRVRNLLDHYSAAVALYADFRREYERLLLYMQPFKEVHFDEGKDRVSPLGMALSAGDPYAAFDGFREALNASAWQELMDVPSFRDMLSARAEKMIQEFMTQQKQVDFNAENVAELYAELRRRQKDIVGLAVKDAFRQLTDHARSPNIISYEETWAHNTAHMVSPYCILPGLVNQYWHDFDHPGIRYDARQALLDIDRGIWAAIGRKYDFEHTTYAALDKAFDRDWQVKTESENFDRIWTYKKGTLHLRFRDEYTWAQFNIRAAEAQGWLPPGQTPGAWKYHHVWQHNRVRPKEA